MAFVLKPKVIPQQNVWSTPQLSFKLPLIYFQNDAFFDFLRYLIVTFWDCSWIKTAKLLTPISTYSGAFLKYLRRLWPYVQNLGKTKDYNLNLHRSETFFVYVTAVFWYWWRETIFDDFIGTSSANFCWKQRNIKGVIAYMIRIKKKIIVVSRYYVTMNQKDDNQQKYAPPPRI